MRYLAAFLILPTLVALHRGPEAVPSIVTVGPNVQVSASMPETMHSEGVILADPTDVRRLLVCSQVHDSTAGSGVVAYLSNDGGRSWTRTFATEPIDDAGDPACAYDADGAAYLTFIPVSARTSGMPVYRSGDGGRTWIRGAVTGALDRESIVVDTSNGPRRGRVYVHGQQTVRSTDGVMRTALGLYTSMDQGRTFAPVAERLSLGRHYILAAAEGVVLSDGRWLTIFGEFKDFFEDPDSERIRMKFAPPPEPAYMSLRVLASDDGGRSLTDPVTIADWHAPNPYSRYSAAIPALAADTVSPAFRDRLYVAWPDTGSGRTEILFSYSGDRGKTWSHPTVINDDGLPLPSGAGPNHLLPAIAVNHVGVVAVTWLDRRDAHDRVASRARVRVSVDGGETFLPSVVLSEASSRFDGTEHFAMTSSTFGGGSSRFAGGLLQSQVFIPRHLFVPGDYASMAADRDGVFHPYWIDNRTGWHQVWTAAVIVNAKGMRNGAADLADLDDLTSMTTLERVSSSYDRRGQTTTMTVRLRNTGTRHLGGPFNVRLIGVESDIGNVEVAGASNGVTGPGAIWDVTSYVDGSHLDPGSSSRPFTLTFQLHDVQPFVKDRVDRFNTVLIRYFTRVLGRVSN